VFTRACVWLLVCVSALAVLRTVVAQEKKTEAALDKPFTATQQGRREKGVDYSDPIVSGLVQLEFEQRARVPNLR